MAFVLNSVTKIGTCSFKGAINDLVIKKSVYSFCDTAKLKMPGLGRVVPVNSAVKEALSLVGIGQVTPTANLPHSSVETAKLFKEGDPVAIDLGYNGDLRNEFRGFVRRVNLTTPLTIDIEGYAWQLRNSTILASWKKTTLKEILKRIIQGTDIVLSPDIPIVNFASYSIRNISGFHALEYIKNKLKMTVYFADNVLYAGLEEGRTTAIDKGQKGTLAEVVYSIGYNCISNQPNLKQRLVSDSRVLVKIQSKDKSGKHTLYQAGESGGSTITLTIPFTKDSDYLKSTAQAILKKNSYEGLEGDLLGFLQPFCLPGWKAFIKDKRLNGARAGTYFIHSTEVTFGIKGARRKVGISYRLNDN